MPGVCCLTKYRCHLFVIFVERFFVTNVFFYTIEFIRFKC